MQAAAPAGSIAASEATQRLCEGYFEFRALGPTAIKGLNTPVEVYEVVRAGPLRGGSTNRRRISFSWTVDRIASSTGPARKPNTQTFFVVCAIAHRRTDHLFLRFYPKDRWALVISIRGRTPPF